MACSRLLVWHAWPLEAPVIATANRGGAGVERVRECVPFLAEDEALAPHIERVRQLVASAAIKLAVEERLGMP